MKQHKHLTKLFGLAIALIITLTTCPQQRAIALEFGVGTKITHIGLITHNGDIPYWNGFDFGPNLEYAEEYQLFGDPGEYPSPAEAAKLTFSTMRDNGYIPDYSDDSEYTLTLVDLLDIESEECYIYRLDINDPSNDTIGAAYAYAYRSGNIYMQGQMGIWVPVENQTEAGAGNIRIGFITQEYLGDNIAEIPYIEYDGDMNPEIESINRSLNQGIQQIYDDFMANADEYEWIEIKSYPFTSDEYLQVVVTYNIYPTYGSDGSMFSINYDKISGKWVSIHDVLDAMGMDQEALTGKVTELFMPETPSQYVGNVEAVGFLYGPETEYVQLLLEVTVENDESEPWKSFYSYIPEFDELLILNSFCLFDPYDMDWMDPPLSWQTDAVYKESTLRVEMDTAGFDELTPGYEYMLDGMLYVAIQELPSVDCDEESVLERIKETEADEIRLITITPSDNHSLRLTYPTWLVVYESGGNEDTSLCTDLYIQTDAGDFRVHTKVPVDYATDYHDEIGRRLDTVIFNDAQ